MNHLVLGVYGLAATGLADLSLVLIPAALTGMVLRRGLMQVNSVGRHT